MTELQQFHQFIGKTLQNNGCEMSVNQCVDAFRNYQNELQALQQSLDAAGNGKAKTLVVDALVARVAGRHGCNRYHGIMAQELRTGRAEADLEEIVFHVGIENNISL